MKLFKILAAGRKSCHGGDHVWEPGMWYEISGELIPCSNGFHLSRAEDLFDWLGEEIWEAEYDGEIIEHGNKAVVRRARITRQCNWTERTARLFACDCAQQVVYLIPGPEVQRCIEVARKYASQEASYKELADAREAAWEASQKATCDAAEATEFAREAVWAIARLTAWVAARETARASARAIVKAEFGDADWNDAREAAWDAIRKKQTKRLIDLLATSKSE
jgi:hypothetical protein